MKKYKEIHIWEFPPTLTFLGINQKFKETIFKELKNKYSSIKELLKKLNKSGKKYGLKRKYNNGHLSYWRIGSKKDRGKIKNINIHTNN